jgi:hypothetical protein
MVLTDLFDPGTSPADLEAERQQRLANGAITCRYERVSDGSWLMTTDWDEGT